MTRVCGPTEWPGLPMRACRSSIFRRPAISRWRAPTATCGSPITAKSTTSPKLRRDLTALGYPFSQPHRHGSHRQWLACLGPADIFPAARDVRVGVMGPRTRAADSGARPDRQKAALLGADAIRPGFRLGDQGTARLARACRACADLGGDRQLSDIAIRAGAADRLCRASASCRRRIIWSFRSAADGSLGGAELVRYWRIAPCS